MGGEIGDIVFFAERDQGLVDHFFGFDPVPVDLDIEVVAKGFFPPAESFFCLGFAHVQNKVRHLSGQTAAGSDEPFAVLHQQFLVYAWDVIESFCEGDGAQLGQVLVTFLVHGIEWDPSAIIFDLVVFMLAAHKGFISDDRLDTGLFCCRDKGKSPVHISKIRQRDGLHAQVGGFLRELIDGTSGLQDGELTVHMPVGKPLSGAQICSAFST